MFSVTLTASKLLALQLQQSAFAIFENNEINKTKEKKERMITL